MKNTKKMKEASIKIMDNALKDMYSMSKLKDLNLSDDDKGMAASIINNFGDGQHAWADEHTIDFFAISYLKDLITRKKFIKAKTNLSPKGIDALKSLEEKLNNE